MNKLKDKFLAFFIGFIDGDGSIVKTKNSYAIKIESHSSWLSVFNLYLFKLRKMNLLDIKGKNVGLNKKGYAIMNVAQARFVKHLLEKTKELKLPILNRKWEKIKYV